MRPPVRSVPPASAVARLGRLVGALGGRQDHLAVASERLDLLALAFPGAAHTFPTRSLQFRPKPSDMSIDNEEGVSNRRDDK